MTLIPTLAAGAALAVLAVGAPALAQNAPAAQASAPLFVFLYRPGPAWKAGLPMAQQGLGPHGAYISRLADEGCVLAGGALAESNGGLAIIRAPSLEAARAILAADPALTTGIFEADVQSWRPRFGRSEPLPIIQPSTHKPAG